MKKRVGKNLFHISHKAEKLRFFSKKICNLGNYGNYKTNQCADRATLKTSQILIHLQLVTYDTAMTHVAAILDAILIFKMATIHIMSVVISLVLDEVDTCLVNKFTYLGQESSRSLFKTELGKS